MDIVSNANGTSRWATPSTGEGYWLEYWKKHKIGYGSCRCGLCGAISNLVGAHVQKTFDGKELYITPLCRSCNQKKGSFLVYTELVRIPSGL